MACLVDYSHPSGLMLPFKLCIYGIIVAMAHQHEKLTVLFLCVRNGLENNVSLIAFLLCSVVVLFPHRGNDKQGLGTC
jgi:hypothetical protein